MSKIRFFVILFVLALSLSACIEPTATPTQSPIVTPTPFQSPLVIIEEPKPVEEENPVESLNFLDVLVAAVTTWELIFLLCFVFLHFGTAVSRAMQKREFQWERVAEFYYTEVLPYGLTYFCLYIVCAYVPTFESKFFDFVYSAIPGLQERIAGVLQLAALAPPTMTVGTKVFKNLRQMGILRIFGIEPEPEPES